jgi:hypothetical protein
VFVRHFIDAIKSHAPEVVQSLRELAASCGALPEPHVVVSALHTWIEEGEDGQPLLGVAEGDVPGFLASIWDWAAEHHLVSPIGELHRIDRLARMDGLHPEVRYHKAIIGSIAGALHAWQESPGKRKLASAWKVAKPPAFSLEDLILCQGLELADAMAAGDTPGELASRPPRKGESGDILEIRCQGWDPFTETRATASARICERLRELVDRKLGAIEALVRGTGEATPSPYHYKPLHFKWLVWFQVQGWSKADVVREHAKVSGRRPDRTTVYHGIESAAEYLLGPGFRTWLRA